MDDSDEEEDVAPSKAPVTKAKSKNQPYVDRWVEMLSYHLTDELSLQKA